MTLEARARELSKRLLIFEDENNLERMYAEDVCADIIAQALANERRLALEEVRILMWSVFKKRMNLDYEQRANSWHDVVDALEDVSKNIRALSDTSALEDG